MRNSLVSPPPRRARRGDLHQPLMRQNPRVQALFGKRTYLHDIYIYIVEFEDVTSFRREVVCWTTAVNNIILVYHVAIDQVAHDTRVVVCQRFATAVFEESPDTPRPITKVIAAISCRFSSTESWRWPVIRPNRTGVLAAPDPRCSLWYINLN